MATITKSMITSFSKFKSEWETDSKKPEDSIPEPPVIKVDPGYNPFDSDTESYNKKNLIEKLLAFGGLDDL